MNFAINNYDGKHAYVSIVKDIADVDLNSITMETTIPIGYGGIRDFIRDEILDGAFKKVYMEYGIIN